MLFCIQEKNKEHCSNSDGGGGGDGSDGTRKRKIPLINRTIDSFFSKKSAPEAETPAIPAELESKPTSSSSLIQPADDLPFDNDIGNHIKNVNQLSDQQKYDLLTKPWMPPQNYVFPHCVVNKKGKPTRKYAQRSHLDRFHWLVLSAKDQGLYCKYCVLFVVAGGGINKTSRLGSLVKRPLLKFDDLLGEKGLLQCHDKADYHVAAVEFGKNFIRSYKEPSLEVINQVSRLRMEKIKENRARLQPIIDTIIFLGRNNIPLRGHRDSGALKISEGSENNSITGEEGIFRALLKFRVASGDSVLENHLKTASSKATYISPLTQNEIINYCAKEIQYKILERVKMALVYAIIFDETTDVAHIEQLSLSFRYVYEGKIREDFITFANAYDAMLEDDISTQGERRLTGLALAHIVLDILSKFSVDLSKCVGVGTDNCSVMSSDVLGAVQEILKSTPNARRCPCANHMLNNSLAKTSKVVACRNTTGTMKKVIAFANSSAKRHNFFKEELGGTVMKGLCETRWAEKHDGHLQFREVLPKIRNCLSTMQGWQDSKTASDAFCLMQAISSTEFVVATVCLCDLLGNFLFLHN